MSPNKVAFEWKIIFKDHKVVLFLQENYDVLVQFFAAN